MSISRFVASRFRLPRSERAAPGSIERWIVDTRVHQGDVALARGNARDAELSYRLALRVDPKDPRARAGFVEAAADSLGSSMRRATFDDALATVDDGLAVDPQSVRLAALKRRRSG